MITFSRSITSLRPIHKRIIQSASKASFKMESANRLKKALDEGKGASMGVWNMIPGSNVARIMARSGVDWVAVDQEHGNIDDSAMHEAVAAIAACGVSPIVRIPDNQGWMAKRAYFQLNSQPI